VTRRAGGAGALALLALAGCATRADIVHQDRQLRAMLQEQRKQLQAVQREVERLRATVEESGTPTGARAGGDDRLTLLEQRLAQLERTVAAVPPAADVPPSPPPTAGPSSPAPSAAVPTSPPPTAPPAAAVTPPAPAEEDGWRRDVTREQAAAGSVNVPERAEYLALLDGLARKDCARSIAQLNGFAASHRESPLADNALFWAARCYEQRGDQNQAISKFYDVVTRYPKGDKAPAALWAQGSLFVALGDSPDARLAFSKLIRDYPASEEAARARQKLAELEN
jgi:tol-pal system protein YbgF